jgi:hypothetical protein
MMKNRIIEFRDEGMIAARNGRTPKLFIHQARHPPVPLL